MSYTSTPRLALKKAVIGSNQAFETAEINANWDKVDAEAVAADVRLDALEAADVALDTRLDAVEAAAAVTTSVRDVALTTDTLLSGDKNNVVRYTSSAAVSVSVPNVLTASQRIDVIQDGTGQVTFTAGSGVTLTGTGTKTAAQYAGATILCVAAGQYRLIGNIL